MSTTTQPGLPKRPRLPHPTRDAALLLVLLALLTTFPALGLILAASTPASAHGTPMKPGSRTFLCWQDALTDTGEIKAVSPACKAAQQAGGTTPFYNWFSVLRSDGAGRTRGFVPDGKLCGGGNPNFTGFDLARDDWPVTHLTAGATVDFSCNAWAAQPGWFYVYVTKDIYDPTKPLTWDEMEDQPFLTVDHPPLNGTPGTVEADYSCSDVVFDGGNGEVTGVHDPGHPTEPPPGTCTASRKTIGTWPGGYQSEVTVTNSGDVPMLGWMADWTLPAGQSVASLWNGNATYTGQDVMVHNADWNGSLSPGQSTTFGYVVQGSGGEDSTTLPCQVG
ncbi:lytic polysaccharide monooxygenase [Streptomyces sp. Ag109_G2-15]|uniref:lytic polysaccharide monooxygenase auxiliary activity family 9 protein n=1 Tax=Streptomyces sp. Ag109_G2-15 TaxID=1938850 RepID=UPI000BCD2213|nr:lytic polysaccharide monooxygenase [Streptomyces sp. Ag109_G2-15]SOD81767.1 chitin-binding protein [Streptomyces sp. Ag109_G2-15]